MFKRSFRVPMRSLFVLYFLVAFISNAVNGFSELHMPKINADRMTEIQVIVLSGDASRLSNALKDEKVRQEINRAVEDGSTALHLAIWKENVDIARILIENGANLEKATANGFTPLHSAILNEQLDIIELLLSHGANPNAADEEGITPLMMAMSRGAISIVKLLALQDSLDISLKNNAGFSAEQFANKIRVHSKRLLAIRYLKLGSSDSAKQIYEIEKKEVSTWKHEEVELWLRSFLVVSPNTDTHDADTRILEYLSRNQLNGKRLLASGSTRWLQISLGMDGVVSDVIAEFLNKAKLKMFQLPKKHGHASQTAHLRPPLTVAERDIKETPTKFSETHTLPIESTKTQTTKTQTPKSDEKETMKSEL